MGRRLLMRLPVGGVTMAAAAALAVAGCGSTGPLRAGCELEGRAEEVAPAAGEGSADAAPAGVVWRRDLGRPGLVDPVGPSAAGDAVLVATSCDVYSVDAATGEPRWHHRTDAPVAALASSGDRVFVVASGRLSTLDLASGTPADDGAIEMEGRFALAVGAEMVFLRGDGEVRGVELETGRSRWRAEVENEPTTNRAPVVTAGVVIVATRTGTVALDAGDGNIVWESRSPPGSHALTVGPGGIVYGCAQGGVVTAFTARDGAVKWTISPTNDRGKAVPCSVSPHATNGKVFVVANGWLNALAGETGDVHWVHRLENFAVTAPVSRDGTIYVGTSTPQVMAVAGADGGPVASVPLPAGAEPHAAVTAPAGDLVVFFDDDGVLYGIR